MSRVKTLVGILFGLALSALAVTVVPAAVGDITTVAGTGNAGFSGDGGPATSANVSFPTGVTLDSSGNLFFADLENHRIRKVDATTGFITTVVGNGTSGFSGDGGPAISATLNNPEGVTVDASGNLFIDDTLNQRIRRVDFATGFITTVAGNGTYGFSGDGGPATNASLKNPRGGAVDAEGNLFIADRLNHRIRKVDATTGIITTVAGNGTFGFSGDGGPATTASLNLPRAVIVDASGNFFIADARNNRIRKVDATTGFITTVAGNGTSGFSGDGGPATSASLSFPADVAIDALANLFIADAFNHRIRRVDACTGTITTVAGSGPVGPGEGSFSGDGGPAASATLNLPDSVTVDTSGNLFIGDSHNHRIRKVEGGGAATFCDVPPDHWAWQFVEAIFTAGLASGFPDGTYRPDNPVTRAEMAVFLKKGIHGSSYFPPSPDGSHPFSDIAGHWAEAWIEDLYDEGFTSGFPDGTYRPQNQVTRAEMAVFLKKAIHGSAYTSPAPDGSHSFSDVAGHWAEAWIEDLYDEGITSGYPDGTYRPENQVTRAEMAVFLVRTFNLPLPESTVTVIQFGGAFGINYSSAQITIGVGDTVEWQGDFSTHPLVSEDGLWATVNSGSTFRFTFTSPGTFRFHCQVHVALGMSGQVTVSAP